VKATMFGTPYFLSIRNARRYYSGYGYDDVDAAVNHKIEHGKIFIGTPPLKPGQTAHLNTGEGRYFIIEQLEG